VNGTGGTGFSIRLADLDRDWAALSALRSIAEARLRKMGLDTDVARGLDRMAGYVYRDQMYVMRRGIITVACHALTPDGDSAFWTAGELAQEALYLDNVIVDPSYARQGLGAQVTRHAVSEARERSMKFLRLDCQRGNEALRAHWQDLGFTWLRDVTVPGRASGTLMEMTT
jgi:ribosomal protein S18 acetylase RimI-like enzyme